MTDILRTRDTEAPMAWDGPNPCPPLTATEDEALRRSISDDGFIGAFPVVLSAGPACTGQVIDGFNRIRICTELGIEPVSIQHPCATELDFRILQIKANLERRQLSTSQRALMGVRLLPLYEERARIRRAATLTQNQSDQSGLSVQAPVPERAEETGNATTLAAQAAGVSATTIKHMRSVTESPAAADLLQRIQSGGLSIKRAYETIRDVDKSMTEEKAAVSEIEDLHHTGGDRKRSEPRDRVVGNVIRHLIDAEAAIRKHTVAAGEVAGLPSRPHTLRGITVRLNQWLGEVEDTL